MTEPTQTPSYRLKLPCADEREFRERFQQKYVEKGIFVPSERPKPVGTRVRLKLEVRTGAVLVSGDGMVTALVQPGGDGKPGMTVRLTALHPDSIVFPLAAVHGTPSHAPSGATSTGAPTLSPPPLPPSRPSGPQPVISDDLFDLDEEPTASAPHAAEADEGVSALTDPAIPALDLGLLAHAPAPTPPPPSPSPGAPPPASPLPAGGLLGRRTVLAGAAGLVLLLAIALGATLSARSSRAERERSAKVEERLQLADQRLLEGRLAGAGGDSALDHLLEAKTLAQADARVTTRLQLLADKFEQLGDRALKRRNLREAAVHFKATLLADPTRSKARQGLDEIEGRQKP